MWVLKATRPIASLLIVHAKTGKDEYDRSVADQNDQAGVYDSIFQGLRADLNGLVNLVSTMRISAYLFPGLWTHTYSLFVSILLCYAFCRLEF